MATLTKNFAIQMNAMNEIEILKAKIYVLYDDVQMARGLIIAIYEEVFTSKENHFDYMKQELQFEIMLAENQLCFSQWLKNNIALNELHEASFRLEQRKQRIRKFDKLILP